MTDMTEKTQLRNCLFMR